MDAYAKQVAGYLFAQSWQIALLAVVVGLISFALRHRSAHIRYLLWLIVLAKCLVPPYLTIPVAVLPQESLVEPLPHPVSPEIPAYRAAVPDVSRSARIEEVPKTRAPKTVALSPKETLVLVWLAGVLLFLVWVGSRAVRYTLWLRRRRTPLPPALHQAFRELFAGFKLKKPPRIWLTKDISEPFVWGLCRGSIYLPDGCSSLEDSQHYRTLLAHELSHIARLDAAVNVLQILAQAIFWFHPFVWWVNKKIRQEREKCCDEMAVVQLNTLPEHYTNTIVEALAAERRSAHPVPSLAIVGSVKDIEERIRTMMRPGKRFYKRPSLIAATVVLLIAFLTVPTALVLTVQAGTGTAVPPLHRAAALGDVSAAKDLISNGVDVNSKDEYGQTPLHLAVRYGNENIANLLISKGANVHARDRYGNMPLHYAAQYEQTKMAELLINSGANVNAKSNRGWTALHFSAEYGWTSLDMAKLLIAKGADLDAEDNCRATPLDMASWNSMKDLVELLMAKGAKHYSNKQMDSWRPLFAAARSGDKDGLRLLIDQGLDVNVRDASGWTPLHHAAQQGHVDVCALLISKGADFNARDAKEWRPLHRAAGGGHIAVVELLLDKGAHLEAGNKWGDTALRLAIPNNQKDVVELLVSKGADINAKFGDDYTPLFYATGRSVRKDIAEFLIAKGADVNVRSVCGSVPLHRAISYGNGDVAKVLIDKGADLNVKDERGQTPLHIAAMRQRMRTDLVQLLIDGHANVNLKDYSGMTALHYAANLGQKVKAELLIANGAELNVQNIVGVTPLQLVAARGHRDLTELFITHGAEVNTKNGRGETALSLAKEKRHEQVVELLRRHGAEE